MRRLLVLLMLTGSLLLAHPPAYAAVSVSVTASRTTLMVGQLVAVQGKASGAAPGSVVRLQHRTGGAWHTVASRRISSERLYGFWVKPPKGYQDYRVRKPAQLGQPAATSATVRLTVRWRPTLTGQLDDVVDPATGAVPSTATGHATGCGATYATPTAPGAPSPGWSSTQGWTGPRRFRASTTRRSATSRLQPGPGSGRPPAPWSSTGTGPRRSPPRH